MNAMPRILILGYNVAGLTVARLIRDRVGENPQITVVDRKGYLSFIPNIPLEVWNGRDPQARLHLPFVKYLHSDRSRFLQADHPGLGHATSGLGVRLLPVLIETVNPISPFRTRSRSRRRVAGEDPEDIVGGVANHGHAARARQCAPLELRPELPGQPSVKARVPCPVVRHRPGSPRPRDDPGAHGLDDERCTGRVLGICRHFGSDFAPRIACCSAGIRVLGFKLSLLPANAG